MGFGNMFKDLGTSLGQKIGAGYAEQGKSWGEVSSMPSSGEGMMSGSIRSGVKTGYDNYMANHKPASVSTSSANMLQTPSVSEGGLAAIAGGSAHQPTLSSGEQNPTADSTQFGKLTNGLGVINGLAGSSFRDNFQNDQGIQNQYGIIGGARLI